MTYLPLPFVLAQATPGGSLGDSPPAASSLGESTQSIVAYDWGRVEQFDDPRVMWGMLAAASLAATALVVWSYRREANALPRGAAPALAALRLVALVGAALFFLAPTRRTDHRVTTPSRLAVLVDSSQSMSVEDEPQDGAAVSRSAAATATLAHSPLLPSWRRSHDVSLSGFDVDRRTVAEWRRGESPAATVEAQRGDAEAGEGSSVVAADADVEAAEADGAEPRWAAALAPAGIETRLGDALAATLGESTGGPLAGIVVVTDGGQTGGVDPLDVAAAAAEARIPIHVVGVGSTEPRRNVRLQDLLAPPRAYPGDKLVVRAQLQAEEFAGRQVEVELTARQGDGATLPVGRQSVAFDAPQQEATVQFELTPDAAGGLALEARLIVGPEDQSSDDNRAAAHVDVVESQTKVLLLASGPTRDYRFLRDQLRRDPHVTVDVLLQDAQQGISQDADKILAAFPASREELFAYDGLVAFDPQWTKLAAEEVALLEEWVSQEAGGLIVVAGPIHGAQWLQSPQHAPLKALYPVEFQQRLTLLDDGLFGSERSWPLEFTRAGLEADFLWLADTPAESRAAWQEFPGVFGCYVAKGPKAGATVYAWYGDPDAGLTAGKPPYLVDHFYGAGRVLYLGSGELWRLRGVDPAYLERLFTQLVRHVSQGRLLRGSSRGRLLADRDRYVLGDQVVVRAQLFDRRREPLTAPQVMARVVAPDDATQSLKLPADGDRPGAYLGQFRVISAGGYRIELSLPDDPGEVLTRRIVAAVPQWEFRQTRRQADLLAAVAQRSAGRYYPELAAAVAGAGDLPPLGEAIPDRAETKTVRGKPDPAFAGRVRRGLLALICGSLCLEWLGRRLLKLA